MNFHIHGDARLKTGKCLRMHNDCRGGFYFSLFPYLSAPESNVFQIVSAVYRGHTWHHRYQLHPTLCTYLRVHSFRRRVVESDRTEQENQYLAEAYAEEAPFRRVRRPVFNSKCRNEFFSGPCFKGFPLYPAEFCCMLALASSSVLSQTPR